MINRIWEIYNRTEFINHGPKTHRSSSSSSTTTTKATSTTQGLGRCRREI
jgi:hypothetical protein